MTADDVRFTTEDERIGQVAARHGEPTSDARRCAPRLLDHARWRGQFRADAEKLGDEDLSAEPSAW